MDISDASQVNAFHESMLEIYQKRLAHSPLLGYTAGPFGLEIRELGGLEAARRQIHSELGVGFTALYHVDRLDLTLEALIYDNPKWHALFSEEELAICAARLQQHGYHTIRGQRPIGGGTTRIAVAVAQGGIR